MASRLPAWFERYDIDAETGCWVWTGSRSGAGYGNFRDGRTVRNAHRAMYERVHGPVPDGLSLDHLCRNTLCVNPEHLEAVTQTENMRRGRSTRLTKEQVAEIKAQPPSVTHADLGARFGVSPHTIYGIRAGYRWVDIEPAKAA